MPPRRRSLSAPYPAWRRSARWTEPCSRNRRLQKSHTITQRLTNSAAMHVNDKEARRAHNRPQIMPPQAVAAQPCIQPPMSPYLCRLQGPGRQLVCGCGAGTVPRPCGPWGGWSSPQSCIPRSSDRPARTQQTSMLWKRERSTQTRRTTPPCHHTGIWQGCHE